jgi:hypothetical protein
VNDVAGSLHSHASLFGSSSAVRHPEVPLSYRQPEDGFHFVSKVAAV